MARILIVEDETNLADGIRFNMLRDGHQVVHVESGEAALQQFAAGHIPFDLVLLDVMLPGIDGFDVVAAMRANGLFVPVLMLTARGRPEDVLRGFEAGADDYLPKPFELPILMARVHGLLRRAHWSRVPGGSGNGNGNGNGAAEEEAIKPDVFHVGECTIDYANLSLSRGGQTTPLTLMEANLLRYLTDRAGQVVPRKALLEEVWQVHEDTDTRAVDNFIVRLRKYLEPEPGRPRHLLTVRGVGYKFVAE